MSRKKSQHKSGGTARLANSASLPEQAEAALGLSRFKQAIDLYKELLKRERRPDWVEGLATAYAGRARDLAAKGLTKEALALWRTRADVCGRPLFEGPYLDWLLKAGETDQALRLLAKGANLPPETQAQLEFQLAAAALVAPDSALAQLPEDSPLLRHRAAAQAALAACARGDDVEMAEQLQAIPFRSPYRDLRPVLKALCATDPAQAAAAAARLPTSGPFEPLAAALRVCALPGTGYVNALHGLSEEARALVLDLKGWPAERRSLAMELAKLGAAPPPAAFYDLLARCRHALPQGAAAQLCGRLLPHAPERLKLHMASFGALPPSEPERVLALAAELKQNSERAEDYWLGVVETLEPDPAQHARAAEVLRHLADDLHRCPGGDGCEDVLDWRARIVELDPDDRATQLKLIRGLRSSGDLKAGRARLDAALARFPKDADVLTEAVETALGGCAFKKAAALAKRVLELDPINPRVRAVIGQAHLSHARKQIEAHKPLAARKELDEAEQWLRASADRGSLKLLRGLIDERDEEGGALLREGIAELGGGLAGSFNLLLEAWRTKRDANVLTKRAAVDLSARPRAGEVVAFAHALNASTDSEKALRAALRPLRPMLERAAASEFSEPDHLLVCEALHRRKERELARRYAEAALKRWPGRPVFIYLRAAAIYGDKPWQMPQGALAAVGKALEDAQAHGDQRTAMRLRELLSKAVGDFASPGGGGFEELDELDELDQLPPADVVKVMEAMIAMGGEEEFLELARQQLGNHVYEELRRELGGDKKQFARALLELLVSFASSENRGSPRAPPPRRKPRPLHPGQKDLFDD